MTDFDFRSLRTAASIEEYGRFQQHLGLIEDTTRLAQFGRAIARRREGGVFVDVGAGTGVLSLIALRCGFERGYLIEPSAKIAAYANHLATLNGLQDRITVIHSTLEDLAADVLPARIDLIISETISSVIFGFGSWDALPRLVARANGNIVPMRGTLYAAVTDRSWATRSPEQDGHRVLTTFNISCDLFNSTFRSGGNVFDKAPLRGAIEAGELIPKPIASFDFGQPGTPYCFSGSSLPISFVGQAHGLVVYWDIVLDESGVTISSLDPLLTSWSPFYVKFRSGYTFVNLDRIRIQLRDLDAPYKYAIQFIGDEEPITDILYW